MILKGLPWRRWKELLRLPSPHRQAEDELRKREARYRTVLDAARDAVITITPDGTIRWFNRGAERIFGHEAKGVIGKPVTLLMPETYRELCVAGLHHYLETGEARVVGGTTELVGLRKDGSEFPIELSLGETREGKARLFTAVIRDITERKEAERRLREAETRYRTLVEQIPAITYIQEPIESETPKAVTYMSPQYETVLGYPREAEILDEEHWLRTLHPEDRKRVLSEEVRTDESGEPFKMEYRVIAADGQVVWVRDHAALVRDKEGRPAYWLGVQYDITDQKRTEEALREARDRSRSVFDHAPIGVAVLSPEGRYLQVNNSLCETLGYSEDELLAITWQEITHPDDLEASLVYTQRIETGEIPRYHLEKRYFHADGHTVWASLSVSLVRNSEGEPLYFIAQIQDITARKVAEEALRRSEASLAAAQRMAHLGSWVSDLETGEMYWSDELYCILGFEPRELVPSYEHFFDSLHPEDKERVENLVREGLPEGGQYDFEFRIILPDGLERIVHTQVEVVSDEAGRPTSVLGTAHDITERKNVEESLELLLRQHEMVLKSAGEGILGLDMHGKVTFTNPAAARMTGWNTHELLGRHLPDLLHHSKPDEPSYPSKECPIYAVLEGEGAHARDEEVFWRKDGTSFPVEYTSTPIIEDDEIVGAVVTFRDITERKTLEEQLHQQAFYDSLTGLLARAAFMVRLEQALARASRQKTKVAVLFADLDNLKLINDTLGHKAGDQLLEAVAERLKDCLRPEDTAARIGGDEFTIFVEDLNKITDVIRIAERIAEALQPPFVIDERVVFTTLSIGIALSNSATERPEDLLRYADLAMYRAKHNGKARYEVFEPSMDAEALERLRMETELRQAMAREQFRIYYQPVVALENGRIAGMEALVRWEHPERGLLLPEEFLAVAEETGLIVPIGQWVLREACKQMRVWQRLYPALALTISVNLATSQFFNPEMVAEVLDTTELDPSTLQLEITESAMTNNSTHSAEAGLRGLKDLGVQLAIDDFGMGHSSLSYLKRFPVDYLKIDRSFVGGLGRDANGGSKDAEIVSAMIKLTHALDLKVIAEGVETAEQMACLRDLGSEFAQGNYFSEPLPAGALSALLRDDFGNRGGSGESVL